MDSVTPKADFLSHGSLLEDECRYIHVPDTSSVQSQNHPTDASHTTPQSWSLQMSESNPGGGGSLENITRGCSQKLFKLETDMLATKIEGIRIRSQHI